MLFRPLLLSGCALIVSAQLAISETQLLPTESLNCQAEFTQPPRAEGQAFAYPQNLAMDSLPSTVAAAVTALTTVQIMRYLSGATAADNAIEGIFTPGFILTVPTDLALTVGTHMIALIPFSHLQKLMAGKTFGQRHQFITRTAVNATLGTGAILTSWALAGIGIDASHIAAAAGLCTAVYPVLMTTKKMLFHWWPSWLDRRRLARLRRSNEDATAALEHQGLHVAQQSGVPADQAKAMLLGYFEAIAVGNPYERSIIGNHVLMQDPHVANLVNQLTAPTIDPRSLMRLRRELVDRLLVLCADSSSGDMTDDILALLRLRPDHDDAYTLLFHQQLSKRAHAYWRTLIAASVIDQALSVGIAGGVFLYGVNQWAATGVAPWFAFQ